MDTPKTIFVDTCIFDGNHYNFYSNDFKALVTTFKKGELTLLMPATTLTEINRHINDLSGEVVKAITKAQHQSPFLTKLDFWPEKKEREVLGLKVRTSTLRDLNQFLEHFSLKKLTYEGVSLETVMYWHAESLPPFSEKKPNEFRDAITLSSLLDYQKKSEKGPVAIISSDRDFRDACSNNTNLIYFSSVDKFLEATLKGDVRVEEIRAAIVNHGLPLEDAVKENFPYVGFTHEDDWDADIQDVSVEDMTIIDYNVIQVGDEECVVSVYLRVTYAATVTMDDPEGEDYFTHKLSGEISDTCNIKCQVKCKMTTDFSKIESVGDINFPDDDPITVTELPDRTMDYYEDDV